MEIGVLGPLRLHGHDGEVEVRGLRERLLVAHLVVAAGRSVSTSTLIDGLWGEEPPRAAAKALQNVVLRVRKSLGSERPLIVTEPTGYRLDLDGVILDSDRFAALLRTGALNEALELWRGPAYAGLEGAPVVAAEARRLEELRASALETRVAEALDRGEHPSTVADLEALVGRYPTRERLWALLMTALYREGRQADALAAYDRARETLRADLGLDPGADLRDLQAKVLAQDPSLDAPRPRPALPPALIPPPEPLVGRVRELQVLRNAWAAAQAGERVLVAVRGPVGAGAHRLVAELAHEVLGDAGSVRYADERGSTSGTGGRRGGPALVVLDRGAGRVDAGPTGHGGRLEIRLVAAAEQVEGARPVDLAPLGPAEVRALLSGISSDAVLDEITDQALSLSGGWPGGVRAAGASLVRARAAAVVASGAAAADRAAGELAQARALVADGVGDLRAAALPPSPPDRSPWPGLAAYSQDDGQWFAGRERLVAELAARMTSASCVVVTGPSGSGKSSAVQAGLLAGLAGDLLPGSGGWDLFTMRPGPHPLAELARIVLGARRPEVGDILERLVRSGEGGTARTVLVVDQLEEAWTLCADEGQRRAFLDALASLVADDGAPLVLLLVVRADYLDRLVEQPALAGAAGDNTVLVGTPTSDDVRRAVSTPALRAGLELDDGLLDAVVSDAATEPGLLPLLSTSMRRLWEQREDNRLTLSSYVATGGLRGAIAHLAESTFAALDERGRRDARALFLRLAGPEEGEAVTRRRVARAEIAALPQASADLVRRLIAARLLSAADDHVEVAHEALFWEWPRLRGWLEEERTDRDVRRRLAVAAADWRGEGEEPALLWRGTRLDAGLEVLTADPGDLTSDERAFLDAGRDAVEGDRRRTQRQNSRLRALLAAALALLVVAGVAGALALQSRDREASAAAAAEQAALSADARRLAATALTEEQPDLALLTAVEATRLRPGTETYGAVLTLLARQPDVVARVHASDRFIAAAADAAGTTVFLGESGPTLHAVDATTGEQQWLRDDLPGLVSWLAVSPDGRTLAVLTLATAPDEQDLLLLLDPATGEELGRTDVAALESVIGGPAGLLWQTFGYADDGRLLVASDAGVVVLDPDGRPVAAEPWSRPVQDSATFTVWPDGSFSAALAPGASRSLVSRAGASSAPRLVNGTIVGVDAEGRHLAVHRVTAGGDELALLDARTMRRTSPSWPLAGVPTLVRFSPDGRRLLVAVNERLELRDGRTLAPITQLAGASGAVNSGVFAGPDGDLAWGAGLDGTAVGYDLTGRQGVIGTWPSPDHPWAGEGAETADVAVWTDRNDVDVNAAYLLREEDPEASRLPLSGLENCTCEATSSDLTSDGRLALAGVRALTPTFEEIPDRGHLVVWDTASRQVRGLVDTPWPVYAVDTAPDGRRAVVLGAGGWGVVDLATLELGLTSDLERWTRSGYGTSLVEVAPDGASAALLVGPDVLLVDLDTGELLRRRVVEPEPGGYAQSAAWSRDGTRLAVGTTTGGFTVLDGTSLDTRLPLRTVAASVLGDVEISPDGRTLATLGPQGDVTLWDTHTWSPYGRAVFDERQGGGFLDFSGDSSRLLLRLAEGSTSSLDVRPDAWVEEACEAASRELTEEEWARVRPGTEHDPVCRH